MRAAAEDRCKLICTINLEEWHVASTPLVAAVTDATT